MMMMATKQEVISYKNHPITTTFLSQFTNWAKIWMSPSKICRKRRNPSITSRETDIRSRTNYYEPPPPAPPATKYEDLIPNSQKALLYRATCQKLRPANNQLRKLTHLGDILHVRKFWDDLEMIVYKDLSNTSHYVPPSKRLPFNPDKPGSIFLPRKSRKNIDTSKHGRRSFASSTIVFNSTEKNSVQVLPLIVPQVDDDDVPLGALHFSNSKLSPLHTHTNNNK